MRRMRVVLDTSVLVAGLRSRRGASHVLLRAAAAGRLVPLVSVGLFFEYEAVLKRSGQLEAAKMVEADVDRFLGSLASVAVPVEVHMLWRPQLADADDELVLEAAVNGRAEALVTHNIRDFIGAAERFGMRITAPGDLIAAHPDLRSYAP